VPRRPHRLAEVPGFGIDRVAAAAGSDPEVLRLENLDTDLPVPEGVIEATRAAVGEDEYNSYLPFTGRDDLKELIARHMSARSGVTHAAGQVVITLGEGDGMVDALDATCDVGDEVILTDPTYAGMINRVRLAGCVPRLVPLVVVDGRWRLDLDALRAAVTDRTRALFWQNPSFPSGFRMSDEEWAAVAAVCAEHDLWFLYLALFEGVVFDGAAAMHPAAIPGLAERTVTIGSFSIEFRMIGWRVGWIAGPEGMEADLGLVHIYNGLTPGGIAMAGARAALQAPPGDLARCNAEWQRRRDAVLEQCAGLPIVPADGAWSMLLDCRELGVDPAELSERLIGNKVAATPMGAWGAEVAGRHLRLVFSNEPVERLQALGERLRAAL
jgi:aspartate/methionine/tyrosine aminotransferase